MVLQLFKDGKEIIGSDGVMYIDGRYSVYSIIQKVKARNTSFEKNFPHKLCDSFGIYFDKVGSKITKTIKLN